MKRVARFGIHLSGALLVLGLGACAVSGTEPPEDAGVDLPDTGPASDAAQPGDAAPNPQLGAERADEPSDVCFDGIDNDLDDVFDCEESDCRTLSAACCVGSTEAGCCMNDGPTTLDFTSCAAGALSTCDVVASAAVFGAEGPLIEAGRLVPVGGGAHAGVALGPRIAPRAAPLTLTARVHVPSAHCLDCVDLAGVALLSSLPADGAQAAIAAGVFVIGARQEAALIIADEVVARAALEEGDSAALELVFADGDLVGSIGGVSFTVTDVALPESVQPAVVGRSDGPAVDSVGVTSASVHVLRCDSPDALIRHPSARIPAEGATWSPRGLGRLSVATVEDVAWVAFEDGGRIELARLHEARDAAFAPGELRAPSPPGSVRIFDPWLEAGEAGEVTLLYVSEAESADEAPGNTELYELRGPVDARLPQSTSPVVTAFDLGLAAIASPTRVQRPNGQPLLVLTGTLRGGGSRLLALEHIEETWALRGGSIESATVATPNPDDLFAFDSDGVGAPALVLAPTLDGSGTLMHLYYTGMRGTRPTIGLLVSQEGMFWRRLGRVLGPTADGKDALGVTDAAPLVTTLGLELHYRGLGAVDSAYGVAGQAGMIGE